MTLLTWPATAEAAHARCLVGVSEESGGSPLLPPCRLDNGAVARCRRCVASIDTSIEASGP